MSRDIALIQSDLLAVAKQNQTTVMMSLIEELRTACSDEEIVRQLLSDLLLDVVIYQADEAALYLLNSGALPFSVRRGQLSVYSCAVQFEKYQLLETMLQAGNAEFFASGVCQFAWRCAIEKEDVTALRLFMRYGVNLREICEVATEANHFLFAVRFFDAQLFHLNSSHSFAEIVTIFSPVEALFEAALSVNAFGLVFELLKQQMIVVTDIKKLHFVMPPNLDKDRLQVCALIDAQMKAHVRAENDPAQIAFITLKFAFLNCTYPWSLDFFNQMLDEWEKMPSSVANKTNKAVMRDSNSQQEAACITWRATLWNAAGYKTVTDHQFVKNLHMRLFPEIYERELQLEREGYIRLSFDGFPEGD